MSTSRFLYHRNKLWRSKNQTMTRGTYSCCRTGSWWLSYFWLGYRQHEPQESVVSASAFPPRRPGRHRWPLFLTMNTSLRPCLYLWVGGCFSMVVATILCEGGWVGGWAAVKIQKLCEARDGWRASKYLQKIKATRFVFVVSRSPNR